MRIWDLEPRRFKKLRDETVLFFQLLAMLDISSEAVSVVKLKDMHYRVNFNEYTIARYLERYYYRIK